MTAIAIRHRRWTFALLGLLAVVMALALWPVSTRQGVDFVVHTRSLPLYVKALEFVDRDANYRALVARVTADLSDEEGRTLALFVWTRTSIRPVPPGFPVVDDHVWNIIVRGYGTDEQRDDVFTTLTTYAGIPGYWFVLRRGERRLTLSAVRVRGEWRLLDVTRGLIVRESHGGLVTLEAVAHRPALLTDAATGVTHNGLSYAEYFKDFRTPRPLAPLRAELQMPGPRLIFEVRKGLRLTTNPRSADE